MSSKNWSYDLHRCPTVQDLHANYGTNREIRLKTNREMRLKSRTWSSHSSFNCQRKNEDQREKTLHRAHNIPDCKLF